MFVDRVKKVSRGKMITDAFIQIPHQELIFADKISSYTVSCASEDIIIILLYTMSVGLLIRYSTQDKITHATLDGCLGVLIPPGQAAQSERAQATR